MSLVAEVSPAEGNALVVLVGVLGVDLEVVLLVEDFVSLAAVFF